MALDAVWRFTANEPALPVAPESTADAPGCRHMRTFSDPEFQRPAGWSPVALLTALACLILVSIWAFTADHRRTRSPQGTRVGPTDVYNPVTAGERLPDDFRQLLPRDAIRPVYDPTFVSAARAGWPDDADVIGVADGAEAKAYPVSFLNRRELVNDEINEKPIVVTW